jgi:NADPH-dependent 7-cyano-7-deazaguanine reductase QueF
MRLCLIITGHIRTFVLHEQVIFFTELLQNLKTQGEVDVYMHLKYNESDRTNYISSEKGIEHFDILLNILNPLYLKVINKYKLEKILQINISVT